jgi:signal transduction histidine kinase
MTLKLQDPPTARFGVNSAPGERDGQRLAETAQPLVWAYAIWIGLVMATGFASVYLLAAPPIPVLAACLLAFAPALVGLGLEEPPRAAALMFLGACWIVATLAGLLVSGEARSPLLILLVLGPLNIWAAGRPRLAAEMTVAATFAYALVLALSGLEVLRLPRVDLGTFDTVLSLAALLQAGAFAGSAVFAEKSRVEGDAAGPKREDASGALPEDDLIGRLTQERDLAEARLESRSVFYAKMGHELRTPLNAVMGFSEVMKAGLFGPLQPKYADYAQLIHSGASHLNLLVDDMLDISKIESGRFKIAPEVIDLKAASQEAILFLQERADFSGVRLSLQDGPPAMAMADPRAVQQILLNLLSNAIKFTPSGGEAMTAIDPITGPNGPMWRLSVTDTGEGISAEIASELGQDYTQGAAAKGHVGTGLGLSVVRAFAELHGGRFRVESLVGEGSRLSVTLPRAEDASPPEAGSG